MAGAAARAKEALPAEIEELASLNQEQLIQYCLEQRKRAEAAERISANLAHEIRSLLYAILANAEIGLTGAEESVSALSEILNVSLQLHRLVNNFLLLQQLKAGQQLPTEIFKPKEITEEAINTLRALIRDKNISIEVTSVNPRPYKGPGDFYLILLLNLLANAIKHAPSNSHIRITISIENTNLVIKVNNQGMISPEKRPTLFKKFQSGAKTASGQSSSGLGLSIAYETAQKLEGELSLVDSSAEHGTTFQLSLPVTQPTEEEIATLVAQQHPRTTALPHEGAGEIDIAAGEGSSGASALLEKTPVIVIIDDNDMNLIITTRLVQTLLTPVKALPFETAEEALTYFRAESEKTKEERNWPDCIITDYQLGSAADDAEITDGIMLARLMLEIEQTHEIPPSIKYLLTGATPSFSKLIEEGLFKIIYRKPIRLETMRELLKEALGREHFEIYRKKDVSRARSLGAAGDQRRASIATVDGRELRRDPPPPPPMPLSSFPPRHTLFGERREEGNTLIVSASSRRCCL